MTPRRELTTVAGACAAAGALALLAAGRTWVTSTTDRPAPLADLVEPRTGGDVAPAVSALALVALAGAVALLATRGWARVATGAVLAVVGIGLAAASAGELAPSDGTASGWPAVALACGVVVAVCGLAATLRGRRWVAMARRYDAPAVAGAATGEAAPAAVAGDAAGAEPDLWSALERGEDPTADR